MTKERAAKTFSREPYTAFEEALKELNVSEATLCTDLGYSDGANHGWKISGFMPAVAARLCAAKVALTRKSSTDVVLLVRVPKTGHSRELLEHLAKSLGLEFVVV